MHAFPDFFNFAYVRTIYIINHNGFKNVSIWKEHKRIEMEFIIKSGYEYIVEMPLTIHSKNIRLSAFQICYLLVYTKL
jgi:hypothetical protein